MAGSRSTWQSNIGFLLAAIGSAIGLGNVWRFSYMAHQYGGGAFLVPYIIALLVAGLPIMLLEYGLGHHEKSSSPLSFRRIHPSFEWLGWWMPVVAMFGIMLYYSVVIGWCFNYFIYSFTLAWGDDPQAFFFKEFLQISNSPSEFGGFRLPILLSTAFVWLVCWTICFREISHGIEKVSKIFMPTLFLLTIIMVGWVLTLDGAKEAIFDHYFATDWSKINMFSNNSVLRDAAIKVWVAAFGQIFFTLSLGFGIMITYASYLPDRAKITSNAIITCVVNCGYSLIAGLAVFGVVGFMAKSQGVGFADAIKGGPQLAFVVYPKAISLMPHFNIGFGVLFFLILVLAGITSGVSLIEAFSAAISDKFDYGRKKVVSLVCFLGFTGALVFTTEAGLYILDIADHFITNYGLVVGGLLECLIVAWVLKVKVLEKHLADIGSPVPAFWNFCVRFTTPIILLCLLVFSLLSDIKELYEGYKLCELISYGGGLFIICILITLSLSFLPWGPGKLTKKHDADENDLLI